jgi:hypothetical protein
MTLPRSELSCGDCYGDENFTARLVTQSSRRLRRQRHHLPLVRRRLRLPRRLALLEEKDWEQRNMQDLEWASLSFLLPCPNGTPPKRTLRLARWLFTAASLAERRTTPASTLR